MNPERLTKLLPQAIDPRDVGRSTARAKLTGPEVAGYLAGLSPQGQWLLRAIVLSDGASFGRFANWWVEECLHWAIQEKWQTRIEGQIQAFARFTWSDYALPSMCHMCGGIGQVATPTGMTTCTNCDGTGFRTTQNSCDALAQKLGLKGEISQTWRNRRSQANRQLRAIEADAIDQLG